MIRPGRVECKYCGHVEVREHLRQVGADSLAMALLERKVKPVRWVVGKRILHCNECGSRSARSRPASWCTNVRFAARSMWYSRSRWKSLQQPEGLVQFQVSRQEATAAIRAELNTFQQRIANLFDNNRIAHTVLEAVYLPFWLFDVFAQVDVTRVVVNTPVTGQSFYRPVQHQHAAAIHHERRRFHVRCCHLWGDGPCRHPSRTSWGILSLARW